MAIPHNCMTSIARERVRVAADRSCGGEFGCSAVVYRVTPIRRNLRQWTHDEQAFCGARMRQNKFRRRHDLATEGDEIEIKRPWPIRDAAPAAEFAFNLL
jgi:hypothetical protein